MKPLYKLTMLLGLILSTGCAFLVEDRSFIDEMDYESEGFFTPGQDFEVTPGDSGQAYRNDEDIKDRTPASNYSKAERAHYSSLRKELRSREAKLSETDYRSYMRKKSSFSNTSEKIYYLKLPRSERERYLASKDIKYEYKPTRSPASSSFASEYRPGGGSFGESIGQGMKKRDVMDAWGRPKNVDIAGNPKYGNERWSYNKNGTVQTLYFENGKVSGWEMD